MAVVVRSAIPLPDRAAWRYGSLAAMLTPHGPDEASRPVVVGGDSRGAEVVTLGNLAQAMHLARSWACRHGVTAGRRIILARLPWTSEVPLARAALALMAAGVRVVLPMRVTAESLPSLIADSDASAVAWCASDLDAMVRHAAREADASWRRVCNEAGVAMIDLSNDTPGVHSDEAPECDPSCAGPDQPGGDVQHDILVLTTSGTGGRPRLVQYTADALMACAEAWNAAGLFAGDRCGGPSICPLLSHSMGLRNVLHAVWNRQPTLLIRPEWLATEPQRAIALLADWPPAHITAGPALLLQLAQLADLVPQARRTLRNLRCVVSSGAGWRPQADTFPVNVVVANAFGTTETQQVLSSLVGSPPTRPDALGHALPGVEIEIADDAGIRIRSPFTTCGVIGEPGAVDANGWIATADRMVRRDDGDLLWCGRSDDVVSSGLGVRLAVDELARVYADVHPAGGPLVMLDGGTREGAVALAFVGDMDPCDAALHDQLRQAAVAAHARRSAGAGSFDSDYVRLSAIGCLAGRVPLHGPGKIDRVAAETAAVGLMHALQDADAIHPQVIELRGEDRPALHPVIGRLQEALRLDVGFRGGRGNTLWRQADGEAVLDLVGGFGANLLGHSRPELIEEARAGLDGVPMLDQGARRTEAEALARELAARVGRETGRTYVVCLASTGSEAVELALRHATLQREQRFADWQQQLLPHGAAGAGCRAHNTAIWHAARPVLIGLHGAFHGKTPGALHLLGDSHQRDPFSALLNMPTVRLPVNDLAAALEAALAAATIQLRDVVEEDGSLRITERPFVDVLALVLEPLQGEGGVVEVPPLPAELRARVRRAGIPLVIDEIQTGLGRTGKWLASEGDADILLLGKALGGGIGKISATLIDGESWIDEFDRHQTSTFADDTFSSRIARRVLRLIDADDVPGQASRQGAALRNALEAVQQRRPDVIRAIRGRGLLLGVEFAAPAWPSAILGAVLARGIGWMAASWLLARHAIRALPTLSAPDTLRIEPAVGLTADEIQRIADAIDAFADVLQRGDARRLLGHLVGNAVSAVAADLPPPPEPRMRFARLPVPAGAERVGFVFNPIHAEDEMVADAAELGSFTETQRLDLAARFQFVQQMRPYTVFGVPLLADRLHVQGIVLPVLPAGLIWLKRHGQLTEVRQQLQAALELAVAAGCRVVSFGALTSVVTDSAARLDVPDGVIVTSGNSFTVAITLRQVRTACDSHGINLAASGQPIGVGGAAGNIGRALATLLQNDAEIARPLHLVGRTGSQDRLQSIADELATAGCKRRVTVSDQLESLTDCDAILLAASSMRAVLQPRHVASGRPVVVADASAPSAVSPRVRAERPGARVFAAGYARLPKERTRLSPHTPPGVAFACLAEALLLALDPIATAGLHLCGPIDPGAVAVLDHCADRHGFYDRMLLPPVR